MVEWTNEGVIGKLRANSSPPNSDQNIWDKIKINPNTAQRVYVYVCVCVCVCVCMFRKRSSRTLHLGFGGVDLVTAFHQRKET